MFNKKGMFLILIIFQPISVIAGSISIKRARATDVWVRNLMRLLINMICTTATCETLIINKPALKFINTSLNIREEKVFLPCLIVEEGGVELYRKGGGF